MKRSRRSFLLLSATGLTSGCIDQPLAPEDRHRNHDEEERVDDGVEERGDEGEETEPTEEEEVDEGTGDESEDREPQVVASDADWPSYAADRRNDGIAASTGPREDTEDISLDVETPLVSSPVASEGRVFFGGVDGALYCVRGSSVEWRHIADDRVASTPAVYDETVYYGDDAGVLHAVDAVSGDEVWRLRIADTFDLKPDITGSVTFDASAGQLYLTTEAERVHGVDVEGPTQLWRTEVNGEVVTAPAVEGEFVYVTTRGAAAFKLHRETGDVHSTHSVGDSVRSTPAAARRDVWTQLYFGSEDRSVYSLRFKHVGGTDTVERRWRTPTDGAVRSSPAVSDEEVYVGSDDGYLYALDREDGSELWRYDAEARVRSSPVVTDDAVYFGDQQGGVHAVDLSSGDGLWSYETDDRVRSSPAVTEGDIYVTSTDGHLYRFL